MPGRRIRGSVGGLVLVSMLALPGCWVWVDHHPRDVDRKFSQALEEVSHLESAPQGRRAAPHTVRLLVYQHDDDELVTLSVPIWLVRKVARHAMAEDDDAEAAGRLSRYGLTLDQILDHGRGLILQADQDDEKVMIWLE